MLCDRVHIRRSVASLGDDVTHAVANHPSPHTYQAHKHARTPVHRYRTSWLIIGLTVDGAFAIAITIHCFTLQREEFRRRMRSTSFVIDVVMCLPLECIGFLFSGEPMVELRVLKVAARAS